MTSTVAPPPQHADRRWPLVAASLFLLLAAWLVWDLRLMRQAMLQEVTDTVVQRSQVMAQTLAKSLLSADYVLRDVAGRIHPAELGHAATDASLTRLLQEKAATVGMVYNLSVMNADCVIVNNARRINLGARVDEAVCAQRRAHPAEQRLVQVLSAEQTPLRRPVIVLSRALPQGMEGAFAGAVLVVIELAQLQEWLSTLDVGAYDNLTLLSTQGVVLARNPALEGAVGRRIQDPTFAPIFGQQEGRAVRVAASPLDGRVRTFALTRVDPFPIWVAVGRDHATALQAWWRHAWQLGLGYVVLAALAWGLLREHRRSQEQRRELLAQVRLTQTVMDAIPHQMAVLNADAVVVQVNRAWREFALQNRPNADTAAPPQDVGTNYLEVCAPRGVPVDADAQAARDGILAVLQGQQSLYTQEYPCHSPRQQRWFAMTVSPLPQGAGAVVLHADITERRLAEQRAHDLAHRDALTGLANRRLLQEHLEQALHTARRSGQHAAVLMIDLDYFKPLNDTHGHAAGDQLLKNLARRLRRCVREVDTAARWGGDEFAVLVTGLDADRASAQAQAAAVAEKVRSALAEPYVLDRGDAQPLQHSSSASVGWVLLDAQTPDAASAMAQADAALYAAKSAGRNTVRGS